MVRRTGTIRASNVITFTRVRPEEPLTSDEAGSEGERGDVIAVIAAEAGPGRVRGREADGDAADEVLKGVRRPVCPMCWHGCGHDGWSPDLFPLGITPPESKLGCAALPAGRV